VNGGFKRNENQRVISKTAAENAMSNDKLRQSGSSRLHHKETCTLTLQRNRNQAKLQKLRQFHYDGERKQECEEEERQENAMAWGITAAKNHPRMYKFHPK
jgi:hypothetical protein